MDSFLNAAKGAYSAYSQSQNQNEARQNDSNNSPYPQSGGNGGYGQQQQGGGEASSYYGGGGNDSNSPYPSQPQQGSGHYGSGGGDFGVQGGSQFNSSDNNRPAANGFLSMLNHDDAVNTASNQSNEDKGLFASAMSFLQDKGDDDDDIDEDQAQRAHQQAYSSGDSSNLGAKSLGSAAALQALKSFTSGGASQSSSNSGGGFQTQLIGQAMSEASKLFDQNGGASDGGKQDVVNMAAKMMMKLMIKNQVSGMMGGGGSSAGGMGQLFSLAQKFM
ncbi:hypothetical protein JCM11641_001000 [Rhodosporidiobolus odoratus]